MDALFHFPGAVQRDRAVEAWFAAPDRELRRPVEPWFERLRGCGSDVRELLHDGHPTACAGDAAFAYVDAITAHASVGFHQGADLDDRFDGEGVRPFPSVKVASPCPATLRLSHKRKRRWL